MVHQSSWTSGSNQRRGGGRWSVKRSTKKRRQMGEKGEGTIQDKVIKGQAAKANWAGRSDGSFVVKP